MAAVRCPACALTLWPRVASLAPEHCPRCLARRRVPVALEPLPAAPAIRPAVVRPAAAP